MLGVLRATLVAGAAVIVGTFAQGQQALADYPDQPITLVVGFSPGGATDNLARSFADQLSEEMGVPVVVENRPGAGGYVGYRSVAAADPDGYTILLAENAIALGKALRPDEPLDPVTDLETVGRVAVAPLALIINAELEPNTLDEFIAYSQANNVDFTSSGVGAVSHMTFEALAAITGIEGQHVPFRGGGESNAAVAAGHVDAIFTNLGNAVRMYEDGSVKALAVSSSERIDRMPDTPTLDELGIESDVELRFWWGMFVPVDTPDDVKARLQEGLERTLQDEDTIARMANLEATADFAPPEDMARILEQEIANWRDLVEAQGITVE